MFCAAVRYGSYLAKVSHVKQVEGFEQVALLHCKYRVAGRQECSDVLQAEELQRGGKQINADQCSLRELLKKKHVHLTFCSMFGPKY